MEDVKDRAIAVLGISLAMAVGYIVDFIISDEIRESTEVITPEALDELSMEYYTMIGDSIIAQACDSAGLTENEISSLDEFFGIYSMMMGAKGDKSEVLDN